MMALDEAKKSLLLVSQSQPPQPRSQQNTYYHQQSNPAHWRNRRITRVLLLYLIILISLGFFYLRYLHRLIFIDYSAFPPRTGPVIIHPGQDPELSVPTYNLTDQILSTTTTTRRPGTHPKQGPLSDENLLIDRAIDELSKRFQSVFIKPSTLSCRTSLETQELIRTRFLDADEKPKGGHKVMIALNLHSSQDVLPAIANAILNSLRYLGIENVFVSVYENGSWDHTPEGLGHLGAVLSGLGVRHHIRSAREETIWTGVDRIKLLSEYRNMALSSFENADRALHGISELVFINDVFLCAQDILELIWERNLQKADASCGTDWRESKTIFDEYGWTSKSNGPPNTDNPSKSVVLYDSWVARSLTGKTLRPRLDFLTEYRDGYSVIFDHEDTKLYQNRFQNALAVPVYSCWNGIVALTPTPFRAPTGLKFRAADRKIDECPSSECQLLAKDFWSLGFDKWILVPKVAVTYTQNIYYADALVRGSNRDHRHLPKLHTQLAQDIEPQFSSEIVDWRKYTKPDTVVCWPDMYKFHIDFEWNHVLESPYNPKLLSNSSSTTTTPTASVTLPDDDHHHLTPPLPKYFSSSPPPSS